jgi:Holliday junction resolvasome RuvABC endonuclease subunit
VGKNECQNVCVLGIAPSTRGFGYAVMSEGNTLVDWGVKAVKTGKKNDRCLWQVAKLIEMYSPADIALENCSKNSRRSGRIRGLIEEIAGLARENGIRVRSLSRKQVNLKILRNETGTKHEIAANLAGKFQGQLSFRLPQKRRVWESEAYQMDIFAAVALAQCAQD